MYFYQTAILGSASPLLTYKSEERLDIGELIKVPIRAKIRDAVVVQEVEEPKEFEVFRIEERTEFQFSSNQLESAKFISEYYFSTLSEALRLFHPYKKEPTSIASQKVDRLPILNEAQSKAYEELSQNDISLLFGVTGSGKTEIYIHKIADMLSQGKSSLLLMPEISLTPQMRKRLKLYFKDSVEIWHSKLSRKKREEILQKIYQGTVKIVAGARSALFLPMINLGVIIIDEEHDDSYKSMNRPRYHARDLAVWMGKKFGISVILSSATPSLTSYVNYPTVRLKEPFIKTKKVYRFIGGDTINPQIIDAIEKNFKRGEQSLIFVPTRANFKYLYCPQCSQTHLCPFCSVGMSLHRYNRHIRCHYCGYTEKIPQECSSCGYSPLKSERIGTQEVAEIISEAIEGIKVEILDKDHITTANKLEKALKRIESGESNVIVGTQMLSKGHDYPNITLSIITGLDYILGISDYKASQRAVGLLHQIAGRSGRNRDATILIQSSKEEYFSKYIDDFETFLKDEIEFAKDLYPPFKKLARVLIADKDEAKADNLCKELADRLKSFSDIEIIGYGKAPIEKIAGKYRYTILLRSSKRVPLLKALYSIKAKNIEIDIDPVDFS